MADPKIERTVALNGSIKLPPIVDDAKEAAALNEGLKEARLSLDWSQVMQATPAFLNALIAGLELDEMADALGAESMAPKIAEQVMEAFEGRLTAIEASEPQATMTQNPMTQSPMSQTPMAPAAAPSVQARSAIVDALSADLVGPFYPQVNGVAPEEVLPLPPSRWYLTGFLAPERARETQDPTSQEDFTGLEDEPGETAAPEPQPKQRHRFPASMGLSMLLPAEGPDSILVTARFAEYLPETIEDDSANRGKGSESKKKSMRVWRRVARTPAPMDVPLDPVSLRQGVMLKDSPGLWIVGQLERAEAPGLEPGARTLALFLVNRRAAREKPAEQDAEFIFQVELEVNYEGGLLPRPDRRGEGSDEWDDRVSDLQFRGRCEYAVGHGVSVQVPEGQRPVQRVASAWLPHHEVRRVQPRAAPKESSVDMEVLAGLTTGDDARARLLPIVDAYGQWLQAQGQLDVGSKNRRDTQKELLERAQRARERIRSGIERLATNPECFEAFRLTNRAMAEAALRRSPERYNEKKRPQWRLFQLAFVLLSLDGIADPKHADRELVELIFFPTGGGKTEAYLGVIAFTLLLRRLRGQSRPDKGLGVAILLRYTLRLLTLDQLGRAATLICALEMLRREDAQRLGQERLSVGLWVGQSATANTMGQLKKQVIDYKNSAAKNASSPFPLPDCPWCQRALGKDSLRLIPSSSKPEGIVVGCRNFECDFSARRSPQGLPVLFVDEQIYRELPAFVVGTVDKFAMLPWRGETGKLFGKVTARMQTADGGTAFFGPVDPKLSKAKRLPEGLLPPELIVQDELHLISGPLGTMVGLYETAVDHLCSREEEGATIRPKVIASTATVRRAQEQIQALFARSKVRLFPPPGVDDSESYFAQVDHKSPGRLYLGIAAQARSMKAILLRAYVIALSAGQQQYLSLGEEAADPYMTVAGYFNSLRELGGMRRLVEDDVRIRSEQVEARVPLGHRGPHPWLRRRKIQAEPVELTSRETTAKIKEAKERLAQEHSKKEHVDVLLASNMISVGIDIDRLGLMVVGGQPKTTAEYIQASSRVGRKHPGLVLTCFNLVKPRDRSHYERFAVYHESFYRHVEATSLTPFSGRALDRGLVGTLVAMTRHSEPCLSAAGGAFHIEEHRDIADAAIAAIVDRAKKHDEMSKEESERLADNLAKASNHLIDLWQRLAREARTDGGGGLSYSRFDRDRKAGRPLLSLALDDIADQSDAERKFVAPTSMRDVEPTVHLWLERRRQLGGN